MSDQMKNEIAFVVLSVGEEEAFLFVDALRALPEMNVEHYHDCKEYNDYILAEEREIVTFICSDNKRFEHIRGFRL